MKLHYATYVEGDYFEKMWSQHTLPYLQSHAQSRPYYHNIRRFDRTWLETTEEYKKNPEKFSGDLRGAGYWRWKPLAIRETLKQIEDGDVVCYFDCADIHRTGFHNFVIHWFEKYKGSNIVSCYPEIVPGETGSFILAPVQIDEPLRKWTRRDAFHYLDCDTEEYWNAFGVEAGMVCFMKCQKSFDFIDEWFAACIDDLNIVEDMDKNLCGKENLPEFIDHRHDQSLLSLLYLKYNLPKQQYNGRLVEGNYFNQYMEEER